MIIKNHVHDWVSFRWGKNNLKPQSTTRAPCTSSGEAPFWTWSAPKTGNSEANTMVRICVFFCWNPPAGTVVRLEQSNQFHKTSIPIGSMYAIYGNIYHQYTPNASIYTIHGSYGINQQGTKCRDGMWTITWTISV